MKKIIFFLSVLTLIFYASCKKSDKCNAGTGGAVTFDLIPQHHGKPVVNRAPYLDSAFIKFNAVDFPGPYPSDYDLVVSGGTVGSDFINVPGMQCGQYYIYMTGFDTVFNARVVGGTPVDFSTKTGTVQFIIPITEII